jgi:predicted regulator of Ras-like GTPase activity (Roadblock/LC7/MglB family)
MFGEVLDSILNKVEGTLGAVVMGLDGISIETRVHDSLVNIEALAAEYSSLLKGTATTTQEIGLGLIEELVVASQSRVIVIRMITPEYFLLALLDKNGNIGKTRFELRKAKFALEKELAF